MGAVTVVGSVHMDLIATADRLPGRGETVAGRAFAMQPGGKGGNQAIAVALQGCRSFMVGGVGRDEFGDRLRAALRAKGVDTSYVTVNPTVPTGASTVLAGADGEYASIIVPGAGLHLGPAEIEAARPAVAASPVLLAQLEIDPRTTAHAMAMARSLGKLVVLNASPVPSDPDHLPPSLWGDVDVLIVNQTEAAALSGRVDDDLNGAADSGREIAGRLGIPAVVVTIGGAGALVVRGQDVTHYPGWPVTVVDTVGAGDALAGALASALARGLDIPAAMPGAVAAGAVTVTKEGAYDALPTSDDVQRFLADRTGGFTTATS